MAPSSATATVPPPVLAIDGSLDRDRTSMPKMGFYTAQHPDAECIFSLQPGVGKPRQMVHPFPDRNLTIWTAKQTEDMASAISAQFPEAARAVTQVTEWEDLYKYFDAVDLYYKGVGNLLNVVNHLYKENSANDQTGVLSKPSDKWTQEEVNEYGDEIDDFVYAWYTHSQNRDKVAAWDRKSDILGLLTLEDWNELIGDCHHPMVMESLRGCMVYWHDSVFGVSPRKRPLTSESSRTVSAMHASSDTEDQTAGSLRRSSADATLYNHQTTPTRKVEAAGSKVHQETADSGSRVPEQPAPQPKGPSGSVGDQIETAKPKPKASKGSAAPTKSSSQPVKAEPKAAGNPPKPTAAPIREPVKQTPAQGAVVSQPKHNAPVDVSSHLNPVPVWQNGGPPFNSTRRAQDRRMSNNNDFNGTGRTWYAAKRSDYPSIPRNYGDAQHNNRRGSNASHNGGYVQRNPNCKNMGDVFTASTPCDCARCLSKNRSVFVAKMDPSIPRTPKEEQLSTFLSEFGTIEKIVVLPTHNNAIVTFSDEASAVRAVEKGNGKPFHPLSSKLVVTHPIGSKRYIPKQRQDPMSPQRSGPFHEHRQSQQAPSAMGSSPPVHSPEGYHGPKQNYQKPNNGSALPRRPSVHHQSPRYPPAFHHKNTPSHHGRVGSFQNANSRVPSHQAMNSDPFMGAAAGAGQNNVIPGPFPYQQPAPGWVYHHNMPMNLQGAPAMAPQMAHQMAAPMSVYPNMASSSMHPQGAPPQGLPFHSMHPHPYGSYPGPVQNMGTSASQPVTGFNQPVYPHPHHYYAEDPDSPYVTKWQQRPPSMTSHKALSTQVQSKPPSEEALPGQERPSTVTATKKSSPTGSVEGVRVRLPASPSPKDQGSETEAVKNSKKTEKSKPVQKAVSSAVIPGKLGHSEGTQTAEHAEQQGEIHPRLSPEQAQPVAEPPRPRISGDVRLEPDFQDQLNQTVIRRKPRRDNRMPSEWMSGNDSYAESSMVSQQVPFQSQHPAAVHTSDQNYDQAPSQSDSQVMPVSQMRDPAQTEEQSQGPKPKKNRNKKKKASQASSAVPSSSASTVSVTENVTTTVPEASSHAQNRPQAPAQQKKKKAGHVSSAVFSSSASNTSGTLDTASNTVPEHSNNAQSGPQTSGQKKKKNVPNKKGKNVARHDEVGVSAVSDSASSVVREVDNNSTTTASGEASTKNNLRVPGEHPSRPNAGGSLSVTRNRSRQPPSARDLFTGGSCRMTEGDTPDVTTSNSQTDANPGRKGTAAPLADMKSADVGGQAEPSNANRPEKPQVKAAKQVMNSQGEHEPEADIKSDSDSENGTVQGTNDFKDVKNRRLSNAKDWFPKIAFPNPPKGMTYAIQAAQVPDTPRLVVETVDNATEPEASTTPATNVQGLPTPTTQEHHRHPSLASSIGGHSYRNSECYFSARDTPFASRHNTPPSTHLHPVSAHHQQQHGQSSSFGDTRQGEEEEGKAEQDDEDDQYCSAESGPSSPR